LGDLLNVRKNHITSRGRHTIDEFMQTRFIEINLFVELPTGVISEPAPVLEGLVYRI
jgi:hypothetical protein